MAFNRNSDKETEFGIIRRNKEREPRNGFREHREGFEDERRHDFSKPRDSFGDKRDGFTRRKTDGERRVSSGDPDNAPQTAIGGIREVTDLLERSPMQVHRVLFMHQSGNPKLYELQKLAKRVHVHVQQVDSKVLSSYVQQHHGVVALLNIAVGTNIEDPRNLGACIRSALALGVDLLMLPAKGMCGITPAVARSAAGALDKMKICRPNNLEAAVGELKLAGYQILGLDADTETNLAGFEFSDQAVIAVGGEDVGLPPFIRKQCDAVLRIPMMPEAHSYNASVALSLGLYEYARLRIK